MTDAPEARPQQLSDDQLRTLAYFAIGVASEGSSAGKNVAYKLSFAGNIRAGVMEPIGNSGFSIGTLQTDLGQHPRVAAQLVDAYQEWASEQVPALELTAQQRQQTISDLQRDGASIRAQNGRSLDATIKSNLDAFLASDDGIGFVHSRDVIQVDRLLRPGDGQRDLGSAMQQLRSTDLYQHSTLDDQARLATILMKLENQAGQGRYPGVLRSIASGDLNSVEDVKTRVDGMLPNRVVRGVEQPDYLESGVEHALQGTQVFNKLRAAGDGNPLRDIFVDVSANPLANPAELRADRANANAMHEYETVKTLFLQNAESPAYINALEAGASHAWGQPQPVGRASATAGLYASGDDLVLWNRDGRGHSFINGEWSEFPRAELHRQANADGTIDLSRTIEGGGPERLLRVDTRQQDTRQGSLAPEPAVADDSTRMAVAPHPLLEQAHIAVERLEAKLGRPFDQHSERLSASSACLAMEAGMTRIDHVVLSERTPDAGPGERVFVVQGDLTDPGHIKAHMSTAQAVAAPAEQSLARLQSMSEDRQQVVALAQGVERDSQNMVAHQPRMI